MKVIEFYSIKDKEHWINQIKKSDWGAGQSLYKLLSKNELKEFCGESTKVFLLTDHQQLVSFCTLADVDDVRDSGIGPWIGFVYTFPQYRGHRYVGDLLKSAYEVAKNDGATQIYISTGETGLYEKYGYSFYQMMKDKNGEDSRVYKIDVR
ncbi:GNAT family N-acetyltransferase [Clostridium sp. E02]|uniref:GNAT family N-acetyltransferase n=1 Tax=Clostridium sp. E02 TaxID=2487134 RepID=UPI000F529947|nr:GNAT family N-acetyltransferase [Clostridium sp. E02]